MPLESTERWHDEVPGTRWFRADLHLHTLDDPYVELPPGIEARATILPYCGPVRSASSTPLSHRGSKSWD
jgi:hypothetical protein